MGMLSSLSLYIYRIARNPNLLIIAILLFGMGETFEEGWIKLLGIAPLKTQWMGFGDVEVDAYLYAIGEMGRYYHLQTLACSLVSIVGYVFFSTQLICIGIRWLPERFHTWRVYLVILLPFLTGIVDLVLTASLIIYSLDYPYPCVEFAKIASFLSGFRWPLVLVTIAISLAGIGNCLYMMHRRQPAIPI